MKLNLGCGKDIRKGYVNYDMEPIGTSMADSYKPVWVDVIGNCEQGLPFKDEVFDEIVASHILEHIHGLRSLKKELRRVMKPNAELIVTVPDYTSPDAWGDDTHCRAFSVQSFFTDFWPGFSILTLKDQYMMKGNGQKVTWLVAHIMKN